MPLAGPEYRTENILEREGKVFEAHSYAGEPHGFRNPMNRVDVYQRL